jgi:hypothetical protein
VSGEPTIGEGVYVEAYGEPIDGRMTHWWAVHCNEHWLGLRRRDDDFTAIMPTPAFWVLVDKLEAGGMRP